MEIVKEIIVTMSRHDCMKYNNIKQIYSIQYAIVFVKILHCKINKTNTQAACLPYLVCFNLHFCYSNSIYQRNKICIPNRPSDVGWEVHAKLATNFGTARRKMS